MKKRFFITLVFILILSLGFTSLPAVYASATSEEPRYTIPTDSGEYADEVLRIIWKYSPTISYLLDFNVRTQGLTAQQIMELRGFPANGVNDIFGTLSDFAHYRMHHFQSGSWHYIWHVIGQTEGANRNANYHFVDGTPLEVYFSKDTVVKTEAATGQLPANLRTYRWNSYASPNANPDANTWGAYGLLEELEAYYCGSLILYEATPYLLDFLDKNGYVVDVVLLYFGNWNSATQAFYEFTFWTLEYMLYLKVNNPAQYEVIMGNESYRAAFTYIYNSSLYINEATRAETMKAVTDKIVSMGIDPSLDLTRLNAKLMSETTMLKEYISVDKYVEMLDALLVESIIFFETPSSTAETPAS